MLGYVPAGGHTQSVFHSSRSQWCGTLGVMSGKTVIGLTRSAASEWVTLQLDLVQFSMTKIFRFK